MSVYLKDKASVEKVLEKAVDNAMSSHAPSEPKKKKKRVPKKKKSEPEVVPSSESDSDEEKTMDLDKETPSDKEFIDDSNIQSMSRKEQEAFEAAKRALGPKSSPKKLAKIKEAIAEEIEELSAGESDNDEEEDMPETPAAPKRKKTKRRIIPSPEQPMETDLDEVEAEETNPDDEFYMPPKEAIKKQTCPFCYGDLRMGKAPNKKTGVEEDYAFCADKNCKWAWILPSKLEEFFTKAHTSVLPAYRFPNQKKECIHGLPMQIVWVNDIKYYKDQEMGKKLLDCIFLTCEIGQKDAEGRVPCNRVILTNVEDPELKRELTTLYKENIIAKKLATAAHRKRQLFKAENTYKRLQGSKFFMNKFGRLNNRRR